MYEPSSGIPYPYLFVDETGFFFANGAVLGSVYSFVKGSLQSPRGSRFSGGMQSIRMNVPRIGGRFAVWGFLTAVAEGAMGYLRQKEDPWHECHAAAVVTGFLTRRVGYWRASGYGALTGIVIASCTPAMIMLDRYHYPFCRTIRPSMSDL